MLIKISILPKQDNDSTARRRPLAGSISLSALTSPPPHPHSDCELMQACASAHPSCSGRERAKLGWTHLALNRPRLGGGDGGPVHYSVRAEMRHLARAEPRIAR